MKKLFLILSALTLLIQIMGLNSEMPKPEDQIQRSAFGVFDWQRNTVSNFEFVTTNYGITGMDIETNHAGGFWPRGSGNQYLFGSGFWFGAKKMAPDKTGINKLVVMSYNPNAGSSSFVPGRIEDGDSVNSQLKDKYRLCLSTDFNKLTGQALDPADGPNWPLWISDTTGRYQYGTYRHNYVHNTNERNTTYYPYGPMFVSDEDIVCSYKDTDSIYDGITSQLMKLKGYPLRLQVDSRIYSWGNDELKDVVLLSYLIENKSNDTLKDCWFAGVFDSDIAYYTNFQDGASNDRTKYYDADSSLELAVAWSDIDQDEAGRGFGYMGISMLETPAVDLHGFIRNDKQIYEAFEQLGLKTFRSWPIMEDLQTGETRYNFISSGLLDGDKDSSDIRMVLGSGPFSMRPGDVAHVVICLAFALPAKGGEADGTVEDMGGIKKTFDGDIKGDSKQSADESLIAKVKYIRNKYYNTEPMSVSKTPPLADFSLPEVWPNPIGNVLHVGYNLLKSGNVRLSLFNQLGQEALVLSDSWQEAGSHSPAFTIGRLDIPSGIYYLRLQSGSQVQTRQVSVVR